MLKSKSVAKLIQDTLNSVSKEEQFVVFDSVGDHKGSGINGVLKQNKATIVPTMNYINANVPYTIEFVVPMQCGEDRVDNIVNIINSAIKLLNGKRKIIDSGKAIFLFDTIDMGGLETRATTGQSLILGLSFSVEYSNKDVGTSYEMALIDNEFAGTINTRYFNSQEEQAEWYESRITKGVYNDLLSPNINALVLSQQRYINDTGEDVNELLMYNYAIIRETKEDGTKRYFYYDITNASVNTNNLIILDLQMDTLQTWHFNPNIVYDDCFISKADINRFIKHPEEWAANAGIVHFDTTINSQLFEREDVQNVTKRLVSREVISVYNDGHFYANISKWCKENVLGWYYLFLDSNHAYKLGGISTPFIYDGAGQRIEYAGKPTRLKPLRYMSKEIDFTETASMYNSMVCVAFPVMKTEKKMYIGIRVDDDAEIEGENGEKLKLHTFNNRLQLSMDSLQEFLHVHGVDYVYAMKFSQVPPFAGMNGVILTQNGGVEVEDGDLYLCGRLSEQSFTIAETENDKEVYKEYKYNSIVREEEALQELFQVVNTAKTSEKYGMFNVLLQYNINLNISYLIGGLGNNVDFSFYRTEIIGAKHDVKFNPKLLSSDYSSLILSDNLQNGAEYDILKLGKQSQEILYTEALTPDISRRYIRFKGNDDTYYNKALSENLTGYIVQDDTSVTLESEAYKTMLANNKNFFLQNSINREAQMAQTDTNIGANIASSALGVVGGIIGGAMAGGIPGAILGAGLSIGSTAIGVGTSRKNANKSQELSKTTEALNVDNLRNAPNSITGAKGNVIFNSMYSEIGIVVERHEILPNEKKMVDDMMNMFGMTLNRVDSIKKYDNIRRYHNYIEADIEGISGVSISNPIRDDIRNRFSAGVRFWNKNNDGNFVISYEEENYERWLEDNYD